MHVLLPPSETKRSGGGGVFRAERLAHRAELGAARSAVRAALERLSADEEAAVAALKLGAKSRGEVAHNLALDESGAMPAIERYTGVLYDALDVRSLGADARARLEKRASIQSALFGLIAAGDPIPAYRLSAGSRLPHLDAPLKRVWQHAHAGIDWTGFGWVLDLRSKDYAELAPLPDGLGCTLEVAQRAADGTVRALNHFNKAAKGDLVRRLARHDGEIRTTGEFVDWATSEGLDATVDPNGRLTLITELGAPAGHTPTAPAVVGAR